MKRTITLFVAVLVLIIFFQCTVNDKSPVGAQFFEWEAQGTETLLQTRVDRDTTYQAFVSTGGGIYLYAGANQGHQTQAIMKFTNLPDSGVVDSVRLTLHASQFLGDFNTPLRFAIHTITNDWESSEINWESFETQGLLGPQLESVDISAGDEFDSLSVILPNDVVQTWIDTTTADENYGVAFVFVPPDTGTIIEFYSNDHASDSLRPNLTVYVTDDGEQTRHEAYPSQDSFLATTNFNQATDRLIIADGSSLRTLFFINTDTIPESATINRALLTLYADTLSSYPNHSEEFSILSFITTDEEWDFSSIGYDSTASTPGTVTGDSMVLNLTFFLQNWVAGYKENHGLILIGQNQYRDLMRREFYDNTHPDRAPKFEVYYSLPPSSRFE